MTTLLCEFLLQKIPLCACTAVKTAATSVSLTMCLLPSWCACECQLDNVPPGAHARVSLTIFSSPSWAHALANLTMFLLVRMRVSACLCSSLCACVCQLDNVPRCAHALVSLTMLLFVRMRVSAWQCSSTLFQQIKIKYNEEDADLLPRYIRSHVFA